MTIEHNTPTPAAPRRHWSFEPDYGPRDPAHWAAMVVVDGKPTGKQAACGKQWELPTAPGRSLAGRTPELAGKCRGCMEARAAESAAAASGTEPVLARIAR